MSHTNLEYSLPTVALLLFASHFPPARKRRQGCSANRVFFHLIIPVSLLYRSFASPFYNIFIVEPRPFSAFIATYTPLPYLTRQTDQYLRGLYSSSRTQLLSTPRSKSFFHFTHGRPLLRPSSQGSAGPLSEVEMLIGYFSTQELFGFFSVLFFFSLTGYVGHKIFSDQFRARVTLLDIIFKHNSLSDFPRDFSAYIPRRPPFQNL